MSERKPDLATVLRRAFDRHVADLRISIPAEVVAYDPATNAVSVQPLIRERVEGEDGEWIVERLPVIQRVPVEFMRGGGMHVTVPVKLGDTGMLTFSDSSLDVWLSEGGEVDPREPRSFGINDATFRPGVRSFKNSIAAATDWISIGRDNAAEQWAVIGEALLQYLQALKSNIDTTPRGGSGSSPVASPEIPTILSASVKVGV